MPVERKKNTLSDEELDRLAALLKVKPEDIKKKILRTVGNPKDRFAEDALRILRAVRFQGCLGFSIALFHFPLWLF